MLEVLNKTINIYLDFITRLEKIKTLTTGYGRNSAACLYDLVKSKHGGCHLCFAADMDCSKCLWLKYTSTSCVDDATLYDKFKVALLGVDKELIIKLAKKRIAELRKWAIQERKEA